MSGSFADYRMSGNCGFYNDDERSYKEKNIDYCYNENILECKSSSIFCAGFDGYYYVYNVPQGNGASHRL